MLKSCIDWLSVTFQNQNNATRFILNINGCGWAKPCKPQFGYDTAVKYDIGIVVMWSNIRHDMGTHIIMSGSTLDALALAGNSARELLKSAISLEGKVTRLDLAIDAHNENIRIKSIYDGSSVQGFRGTAKRVNLITGNDGGITMYIGSRDSDKFARLYDKGIQTKTDENWKRLEVELKGDVAKQFARVVAMNEDKSIASFVWGIASSMFNVNYGGYPIFGIDSSDVSLPKIEKTTDTEKWLLNQIIPLIERYVAKNPQSAVYDDLINALIKAKKGKDDKKNSGDTAKTAIQP